MIDKVTAEQCALCGSCRNACPVDAISFDKKHLDFRYPRIDTDRCIGCNRCEKVCPVHEAGFGIGGRLSDRIRGAEPR